MGIGVYAEPSGTTSRTLLARVQQHDAAAWERFTKLYGPMVYGWCRHSSLSASDAADVTQEVFISVLAAVGGFRRDRPGDTLRGWLRTICRNKLNDFHRRRAGAAQARGGSDAALRDAPAMSEEDDSTFVNERQMLIRRAAELVRGEFEPRTWQAFWLTAVELQPAAETAAQLDMTPGAVRQAKYMILKRLREELHGELD